MNKKLFTAIALVLFCAVGVVSYSPSIAAAATGDFCQAAGQLPGHRNSTGLCVPDEMIGQACGTNMHYDSKGDCVADAAQKTDCERNGAGGICDASGKIGHCDQSLTCVADGANTAGPGATTGQTGGPGATTVQTGGPGATTVDSGKSVKLLNPLGTTGSNGLESFLNSILDFVIRIGTVVVVLMMVYVGFKFVTAQGDPGEITKAREMLLWTVVGALVLLGSKVLAAGIEATVKALSVGG